MSGAGQNGTVGPNRDRKRLLIIGDGAAPTGFARVVRNIFAPMVESFELHQLAVNYYGDPHDWPWKLYPAGQKGNAFGADRLEERLETLRPDLVFVIADLWTFPLYLPTLRRHRSRLKIVYYCPVEAGPLVPDLLPPLREVDHLVFYTRTAERLVQDACAAAEEQLPGLQLPPTQVIPHGIDMETFHPLKETNGNLGEVRRAVRRQLFPGDEELEDAFIVLNANRNQPRKRIDLTLEAFALFAQGKPSNVRLYLHMGLEDHGWGVPTLARRFGVYDRLIVTQATPAPPAVSERYLNQIYNACDVGINTSLAEGWGLVSFEHAATHRAQIVPGFGSCLELWEGAAELLPPARKVTLEKSLMEGWLIDPQDAAQALERLYQNQDHRQRLARAAFELATSQNYQWSRISKRWGELFDDVLAENRSPTNASVSSDSKPLLEAPYIFLHIPKTGGTTLGEILRANFNPEDVAWHWSPPEPDAAAGLSRKRCLIGHLPYGAHDLFADPCTYIAVLRNPYERVISQYFYNLAEPQDPHHTLARDNSLEGWLDLHPDAHDLQVQFLSGQKGPPPDRQTFLLAAENLKNCGVVGLLEDFEGTLFLLRHYLGLEQLSYTRAKENPQRHLLHEISPKALAKIQCYNALDMELYRLAQQLFLDKLQEAAGSAEPRHTGGC